MTSAWITAIASFAGAVVGAGATLSANWLVARSQSRTQLKLAVAEHENQMVLAATQHENQLKLAAAEHENQLKLAAAEHQKQMVLAAAEHEKQSADVRRAACEAYLTAVDSFTDQARELVARMDNGAEPAACKDAHDAYLAGWELLQRVCAPVVIAGPSELAEQAEALKLCLGDLADVCDGWYAAYVNGSARGRGTKVVNAQGAAHKAKKAFESVAREHGMGMPLQTSLSISSQ